MIFTRTATAVVLLALSASNLAAAQVPDAEAVYQQLADKAARDSSTTDWHAVRLAYFNRPRAAEIESSLLATRTAMFQARRSLAWTELLRLAQLVIASDIADGEAHLLAASALAQLGRATESDRERAIAVAIFRSMLSKDGTSAANAIEVFSVNEEYALMNARQRRVTSQSLRQQDGHSYDVLETMGQQGVPMTFWFQIDRVIADEATSLGPRAVSGAKR